MNIHVEHARDRCRRNARALLELRKRCHKDPGHSSDGCGYYMDRYCFLRVDCRMVQGAPLCWISIIDHYTGEVLFSKPCGSTPGAAEYGRAYFTRKTSRK